MDRLEQGIKELEDIESQLSYLNKRRADLRDQVCLDVEDYFNETGHAFEGLTWNWVPVRTRRWDFPKDTEHEVTINGQTIVASISDLIQVTDSLKRMLRQLKAETLSIKKVKK